jgi:hypothetical protein
MRMFIVTTLALAANLAMAQLAIPTTPDAPVTVSSLRWVGDPDCRPGICPHGIHHVPGMLPGHPTAATLWPRIIRVECTMEDGKMKCDYPARTPSVGRGEYVMYEPVFKKEPIQQVIIQQTPAEVIVKEVVKEVTVIKEVPPKKIRE